MSAKKKVKGKAINQEPRWT